MKETLVRASAWFGTIFYLIMSLVSLIMMYTERIEFGIIVTFFMFILMSVTSWFARKFGLAEFKTNLHLKLLGILTFVFGIFFLVLIPIMLTTLYEFNNSLIAIITLFILFTPAVISAITLLFGRSKTSTKPTK